MLFHDIIKALRETKAFNLLLNIKSTINPKK